MIFFLLIFYKVSCFSKAQRLVQIISFLNQLQQNNTINSPKQKISSCQTCHKFFQFIQNKTPIQPQLFILDQILITYCTVAKDQTRQVCRGYVKQMSKLTDPHSICHILKFCPLQYQYLTLESFKQEVMKDKPKNNSWPTPTQEKVINIIHLTDVHLDFNYQQGTHAKCSQPLCCRKISKAKGEQMPAGKYGSLSNCDIPKETFNLFLQKVRSQNIDLIIWTGDNCPHDVWKQSLDDNLKYTQYVSEKLQQQLDIMVIPSTGNHQSFPVNVYDYFGDRQSNFLKRLSQMWEPWLGKQTAQFFSKYGYYSKLFNQYNLKVLTLNTQSCNDQNWYLLRNPTDPGNMLQWMLSQLRNSQQKKQNVYIIGHIPTNCLIEYSDRYAVLIERFSHIIKGQFYGHTHLDTMGFFISYNNKQQYVGYYLTPGSLTTFSKKNPEYRIYNVDLGTMQFLNYQNYRLNLNDKKISSFEFFYDFKKNYSMLGMSLKQMKVFHQSFKNQIKNQVLYTYFTNAGAEQGKIGDIYCSLFGTKRMIAECQNKPIRKEINQIAMGPWKKLKQDHNL